MLACIFSLISSITSLAPAAEMNGLLDRCSAYRAGAFLIAAVRISIISAVSEQLSRRTCCACLLYLMKAARNEAHLAGY